MTINYKPVDSIRAETKIGKALFHAVLVAAGTASVDANGNIKATGKKVDRTLISRNYSSNTVIAYHTKKGNLEKSGPFVTLTKAGADDLNRRTDILGIHPSWIENAILLFTKGTKRKPFHKMRIQKVPADPVL